MFDLDFYTSTMAAFGVLLQSNILPRVWRYFDDIRGYPGNPTQTVLANAKLSSSSIVLPSARI
jgi:hypothetical protein